MSAQLGRNNQFSKTRLCRFEAAGACAKGPACPFAHGEDELRPTPDLRFTKICKALIERGACDDPECTYAHSKVELRLTPGGIAYRKTKLCRFIQAGRCKLGPRCGFAHSVQELGSEPGAPAPESEPSSASSLAAPAAPVSAPAPPWGEEAAPAPLFAGAASRSTSSLEPALPAPMYVPLRPDLRSSLRAEVDMHREGFAHAPWESAGGGYFGASTASSMLRPLPPGNVLVDQTNDVWSVKGLLLNAVDAPPANPIRAVRSSASTLCSLGDTVSECATLDAVLEEPHVFPRMAPALYADLQPPQQPPYPPSFSGGWPMHVRPSSSGL